MFGIIKTIAWADMVMVSGMLIQAPSMREVLARARAAGVRTVVGGPAASTAEAEFGDADVVFAGEVEGRVDELLAAIVEPAPRQVLNAPVDDDMSDVDRREAVTRLRGRVTSLSGGGLAIVVQQPIPKHVLLRITLDLVPEPGSLRLTARPVGSSTLSAGKHLVRCAFAGISDEVREDVSQYVFHRQGPIQAAEAHAQGEEE